MADQKEFQCLRCEHRYRGVYDARVVVERSCPRCGSNSVRLAPTPAAPGDQDAAAAAVQPEQG